MKESKKIDKYLKDHHLRLLRKTYKEYIIVINHKMMPLKITTISIIVKTPSMIKKGTNKHINEILGTSSLYRIQKIALS